MAQTPAVQNSASITARLRAEQRARDMRRRVLVIAVSVITALAIIGGVWGLLAGESRRVASEAQAAGLPIVGVKEMKGLSRDHVTALPEPTPSTSGGTILPPAGGPHDPVLQNCGVYSEPVATAKAVHSLEHGAVWIAYRSGLDQQQVDVLKAATRERTYTLLSPIDALDASVVLTAWGVQLELKDASDPRLKQFLNKYVQGEQTPEPGAPCSGGFGAPE
ncbi:DUF3105 domain-containing protein [Demequina lutea]|uniref:DUF3105 domain-containing protein n=1 Tax=Demequina lutea TaxID=431489 RepID=A0A7Y9Z9Y6_9MICO|nr:DUF3105 domain-containing protein [Demequina lutea]NYI41316.1 hypothetical protein [Demequina lutea]